MTIQAISNTYKNCPSMGNSSIKASFRGVDTSSDSHDDSVSFEKYDIPQKTDKSLLKKVFCTTLIGVSIPLAFIMKKNNYSLSLSKIFHESPKNWGIFKIKEYDEKAIPLLALGSVGGGLAGGLVFDKKENRKAKLREAVIQMIGNIMTPLTCVYIGSTLYKKNTDKINSMLPQMKESAEKKLPKYVNKIVRAVPAIGSVAISLATGIVVGNKVSNAINHKLFHRHDNRNVRIDDFSAHIDDTCLAVSLVAKGDSPISVLNKVVPAALMVAGVSTGTVQDTPDVLPKEEINKKVENDSNN